MAWSIAEVARVAKVTSRTLRHYDEIGLLPPAFVSVNGYRHYEEEQLLRLQQLLLLREHGWVWQRSVASWMDHSIRLRCSVSTSSGYVASRTGSSY